MIKSATTQRLADLGSTAGRAMILMERAEEAALPVELTARLLLAAGKANDDIEQLTSAIGSAMADAERFKGRRK